MSTKRFRSNILANSAQARKRARQADKRNIRNASARSMMRTYLKRVVNAVAEGNKESATEGYKVLVPILDKSVSKGLMHKNKAARYKSRLNSQIKAL